MSTTAARWPRPCPHASPAERTLRVYSEKRGNPRFFYDRDDMGLVWSVLASLLFSFMGVFVKLGSQWFSASELVFWRSFLGLLVLTALLRISRASIRTPLWRWHMARGISGSIALLCFFFAIAQLPLSSAISLNYTSPLFLALYVSVQQGRRPSALLLAALLAGFGGVWLMLQPTFSAYSMVPVVLGLLSGALAGFAYLAVRELGEQGEPPLRIVWYFTLTALVMSVLWTLPSGWHFPLQAAAWWVIAGLTLSATFAQIALTRAYRCGPTLAVSCLAYTTVLFSGVAQWLLWPQTPSHAVWLGQGLIIISGVMAVWSRSKRMV